MDIYNEIDYMDSIIMAFIEQCGIQITGFPSQSLASEIGRWGAGTYEMMIGYLEHLKETGSLNSSQVDRISYNIDMLTKESAKTSMEDFDA